MNQNRGRRGGHCGGTMPGAVCVCPLCGYRIERPQVAPCYTFHCPRCEAQMVPG
ncbi:MAG TPA: hypothetical protein HA264_00275 [Methanolinea sp.]|nr:hypothetical protein [Methanolinea sp.]HNQ29285.1 hypothetical protein [Methanolinea sp.]